MSVKQMTTEEIQADLEAVSLAWPEGTPPEQFDRVNALRGELKRRAAAGEDVAAAVRAKPKRSQADVKAMDRDALVKELRELATIIGQNSGDEAAQQRFADVRYELRARAKASDLEKAEAPAPQRTSALPPRALELPDEDKFIRLLKDGLADLERAAADDQLEPEAKTKAETEREAANTAARMRPAADPDDDGSAEDAPQRMVPRRSSPTPDARAPLKKKHAPSSSPVNGFIASPVATTLGVGVAVNLEYERRSRSGAVCMLRQFSIHEMDEFIAMCQAARDGAVQSVRSNVEAALDDDED